MIGADSTPVTPFRIPVPRMVAMPPGDIPVFGLKLAPFTIERPDGPRGWEVRVKLTLKVDELAVTVMLPGVAPAVTVVEAWPLEFVIAEEDPSVAVPAVIWKLTWTPGMPLPLAFTTWTTSGEVKAVPIAVVC